MDTSPTNYHDAAASVSFDSLAFIDGRFVPSQSGKTFSTYNPANGRKLADIAECDTADVDLAVSAARRSFEDGAWSRMAPRGRKKILLKLADLIEDNFDTLSLIETLDSGKPITDARSVDLPDSVETLRWHAEAADKLYDKVSPTPDNVVSMIVREPIGVVAGVLPWNFPLFVAMWKLAPALAGGNSVILKPAELTSLSLITLAKLAAEAGIPDGVFNIVPGFGETAGQALGRHQDVDCVSFTGSGEVGRYFLKYAADSNLKRVVLECGGKSPAVVMDDITDISQVAAQIAIGFLSCQGENCSAGSRLIVHRGIKERLITELLQVVDTWKVGDPLAADTKIGAMIEEKHLNKVLSYISAGRKEGAKIIKGGARAFQESGGYYVEPTMFDGVSNKMTIARDEIFGPVLSIIEFSDVEDAIKLANDTSYGLAASLYTSSLDTAHRVAKSLRAGTVSVNCFSEGDMAVPFGGYKESGFGGRDKGLHAHDQYTETKTIWIQLR
jgi:gamma-glutamyl-gamma-aminobutyraldehyde dehydrogenase